ncbi:unnamed protein product [Amoebophrya sp. A120]|nr:unnamed protein product [Amoebophrya sp. A120]|eukprot:GSA120T00016869001.1
MEQALSNSVENDINKMNPNIDPLRASVLFCIPSLRQALHCPITHCSWLLCEFARLVLSCFFVF